MPLIQVNPRQNQASKQGGSGSDKALRAALRQKRRSQSRQPPGTQSFIDSEKKAVDEKGDKNLIKKVDHSDDEQREKKDAKKKIKGLHLGIT